MHKKKKKLHTHTKKENQNQPHQITLIITKQLLHNVNTCTKPGKINVILLSNDKYL